MAMVEAALSSRQALWCARRIVVTVRGPDGKPFVTRVDKPYARVGSHPDSDVRLTGPDVPPICIYLHATDEGIYCLGLKAGKLAAAPPNGWLRPKVHARLGPYRINAAFDDDGPPPRPVENDPRSRGSASSGGLRLRIESPNGHGSVVEKTWRRQLTLIGRQSPSTLRLVHPKVSKNHCILFHDDSTVWVVDLLSNRGTRVDGSRIEAARLQPGQLLEVGGVHLTYQHTSTDLFSLGIPAGADSSELFSDAVSVPQAARDDDAVHEITLRTGQPAKQPDASQPDVSHDAARLAAAQLEIKRLEAELDLVRGELLTDRQQLQAQAAELAQAQAAGLAQAQAAERDQAQAADRIAAAESHEQELLRQAGQWQQWFAELARVSQRLDDAEKRLHDDAQSHHAQREQLSEQARQLQHQLDQRDRQLADLQPRFDQLTQQAAAFEAQRAELQQQLAGGSDQLVQLQSAIQQERQQFAAALEAEQDGVRELQSQLDDTKAQLHQAQLGASQAAEPQLQPPNAGLAEQLARAIDKLARVDSQQAAVEAQQARLVSQHARIEQQLAEAHSQSGHETQVPLLEARLDDLAAQLAAAQSRFADSDRQRADLQLRHDQLQQLLVAEREAAQHQAAELVARASTSEQGAARAAAQLDAHQQQARQQAESLAAELADQCRRYEDLSAAAGRQAGAAQREHEGLRSALVQRAAELERQLADAHASTDRLQAELASLAARHDQLQSTLEHERQAARDAADVSQAQLASLEADFRQRCRDLDSGLADQQAESARLRDDLSRQVQLGQSLESAKTDLAARLGESQSLAAARGDEIAEHRQQAERLARDLAAATARHDSHERSTEELAGQLAHAQSQLAQAQAELAHSQAGTNQVSRRADELAALLADARRQRDQFEQQASQLKQDLQHQLDQLDQLRSIAERDRLAAVHQSAALHQRCRILQARCRRTAELASGFRSRLQQQARIAAAVAAANQAAPHPATQPQPAPARPAPAQSAASRPAAIAGAPKSLVAASAAAANPPEGESDELFLERLLDLHAGYGAGRRMRRWLLIGLAVLAIAAAVSAAVLFLRGGSTSAPDQAGQQETQVETNAPPATDRTADY